MNAKIFEAYLKSFSLRKPKEFKIIVIDNAGFHSTKNIEIPENIYLLRIPPYSPELNPCEQIWAHIKYRFRNKVFKDMVDLRKWLHQIVKDMKPETIMSIVKNKQYLQLLKNHIIV